MEKTEMEKKFGNEDISYRWSRDHSRVNIVALVSAFSRDVDKLARS